MLEKYTDLLHTIREFSPTAHIGGGAVRDTLLARPINDVDLFLDEAATDRAADVLRSQFGYVKVGEWTRYEEFSDPAVARLAKFEKADETTPVCLIGLTEYRCELGNPNGMRANLSRFDFGICMVGWDGDQLYTSPRYNIDAEAETFTLCRADNLAQFKYSMSRYKKMSAGKYADWKLVVPTQFERFARQSAFDEAWYREGEEGALKFSSAGRQVLKPKSQSR